MATKAVIDTTIWISSIIQGKLGELVGMAFTYDIEFIRCKDLTDEIAKVLSRPKFAKHLVYSVEDYIDIIKTSTTPVKIRHRFTGCRDPKNNYLFDLTIQGKAKYIVSGDKDIIKTPTVKGVEVVTFTEFLHILKHGLN